MATDAPVKFSPQLTQQFSSGGLGAYANVVDQNLLKLKKAIDDANATFVDQRATINRLIQTVNISVAAGPAAPSMPPGFAEDEPDSGGLPGGGVGGMAQARYWISTSNPSLPYAVNMGALGAGVLQQTVAGGVSTPGVYQTTTNRILLGTAAGGVTDTSLATWDGTRAAFGTAAPLAQSVGHFYRQNDGQADLIVANDSTGTAAQCAVRLTRGVGGSTDSLLFALLGTNFAGGGFVVAKSALFELEDAGNFIYSVYGAGDHVWATTISRTERMRIANGGNVSIANLTAGGVVYATAATGVLKIGTPAEVAAAITWPAAKRVLFSSGTTTAPSGNSAFQWDDSTRALFMGAGASQAWANLGNFGDANTEYVESAWSANVWILKSKKTGVGTVVRSMKIDADTATLTLNAAAAINLTSTTGISIGTAASTAAITMAAGTSITMVAGAAGGTHPSLAFASSQITLDTSIALSGGFPAGSTWNGFNVTGGATVPGTGTITAVFASTKFSPPTITGTGVGATVNEAATVLIAGGPIASALSINVKYALWVQADVARFDGTMMFPTVANGAVATALTSVGPVGSHTTVQKWFKFQDSSTGIDYYVPGF